MYSSPEQPPKSASVVRPASEPFKIAEDSQKPSHPEAEEVQACDVPMSPEGPLKHVWLTVRSPEAPAEPDLDAFLSPCHPRKPHSTETLDVPMSPLQPPSCADVPMSPLQPPLISTEDEPMTSPGRGLRPSADVSMNAGAVPLVSDPWDSQLISDLLSTLNPPLTSHPRCITWQRNVPGIAPKMTISMGETCSSTAPV